MVKPLLIRKPATMPDRPTTEPTDKSIPPVTRTYVIPIPKIPYKATCFAIRRSDCEVKKDSLTQEKKITNKDNTIRVRPLRIVMITSFLFIFKYSKML